MSTRPTATNNNNSGSSVSVYKNFIANAHQHVAEVTERENDDVQAFNEFVNVCLAGIPAGGAKNPYGYSSHMGEFVRLMSQACDEYIKAKTCFHAAPHE